MSERILGVNEILALTACRPPLLMLDRAELDTGAQRARGIKNITINEPYFCGHFPAHAITPGVLQLAAIQQLAEVVASSSGRMSPGKAILRQAENTKFRKPVGPGDQLLVEVELDDDDEDGRVPCRGTTRTSAGLTCEASLVLACLPDEDLGSPAELTAPVHRGGGENAAWTCDVEGIRQAIPHRFPFLFIDRLLHREVDEQGRGHISGLKNVSFNESCFNIGSAGRPLLPSFIQMEIAAQVGCAFMLTEPTNRERLAYFMSIDHAAFFQPVTPGDQLLVEIELAMVRNRFGRGSGKLYVGDTKVSEIELKFALMDP